MTSPTIVLVEDDPHLRTLTTRALPRKRLYRSSGGQRAGDVASPSNKGQVDLVLLDIMLPGTSGIDLCREIRRTSDVPIIFISAKSSETDRVIGLELGADDYLPKPFGTRELIARVRAVLRRHSIERAPANREKGELEFNKWRINLPRRELKSPTGAVVDLTGAEFDLLGQPVRQCTARDRPREADRIVAHSAGRQFGS